jgi:succinate dehydrogenase / fumarate reductase cytochrome b subunit
MNLLLSIWRSSLGKKYVMALTGAALLVFVTGHLVGNLQVFGSPDLINGYAHFLKSKPGLLWGARLGLLGCVGLHIAAAVTLLARNRAARPEGYAGGAAYGSTVASRTMPISGSVILAFVIYHLLHFTALQPGVNGVGDFSRLQTTLNGEPVPDVYAMMILGFQVWWVALFYLIAQALLFMHLGHGVASMFQSLGFRDHVWWPRIQALAKVVSVALFLGYASIPVAILAGGLGAEHAAKAKLQLTAPGGKVTGQISPSSAAGFASAGKEVVR